MSVLKEDVVTMVAERTGYTKAACREFLEATLDIIKEQLNMGEQVKFTRFFALELIRTDPQVRFDVHRQEHRMCKPHKRIVFTPSPQLIDED